MGLLRHRLDFAGEPAGYITSLPHVWRRPHGYLFMPSRSLAHFRLCEALRDDGTAAATVTVCSYSIPVIVSGMAARRIVLSRADAG